MKNNVPNPSNAAIVNNMGIISARLLAEVFRPVMP